MIVDSIPRLTDDDDNEVTDTSVIIAFTPTEMVTLNNIVQRYVPLAREPELATLRDKVKQALDTL
jgi:hypothetical protein